MNATGIEQQAIEFVNRHNESINLRTKELGIQMDEMQIKIESIEKEIYRMKQLKKSNPAEFSKERADKLKEIAKDLKAKSDNNMVLIQEWEKRKAGFASQVHGALNNIKEHEIRRLKGLRFEFLVEKIIIREKKWDQEAALFPPMESMFGEIFLPNVYGSFEGKIDELKRSEGYSIIPENDWELRMLSIGNAMGLNYPELLSQHTAYSASKKLGDEYLKKFAA